jgi:hypothetical protein
MKVRRENMYQQSQLCRGGQIDMIAMACRNKRLTKNTVIMHNITYTHKHTRNTQQSLPTHNNKQQTHKIPL